MRDGNVERRRLKERDPTIVVFDQYAFDLTRLAPAPQVRDRLAREIRLGIVVSEGRTTTRFKNSPGQFRVELHERIIAPLYPLAFGVIAFAVLGISAHHATEPHGFAGRGDRRRSRGCGWAASRPW